MTSFFFVLFREKFTSIKADKNPELSNGLDRLCAKRKYKFNISIIKI